MEHGRYWDKVVQAWPQTAAQRLLRAYSDAVNRAWLERELPARAGRVLKTDAFDEAVGRGLVDVLLLRSEDVTVVDVAPAIAEVAARANPDCRVDVADLRALPYGEGSFDTVVSNSTLDHFGTEADIVRALGELQRVLVPGGLLLISLDNLANPLVALRNALPQRALVRARLVPHYVGKTYGPRGLRRIVTAAGFEVGRVEALMHVPRVAAVAAAALGGGEGVTAWIVSLERLGRAPTRFVTGQFVAARAIRR